MWVQLRCIKHIEVRGKLMPHQPGDWVDVGKGTALQWISNNEAWVPDIRVGEFLNDKDAGALIVDHLAAAKARLGDFAGSLSIEQGQRKLPWSYTMIWHPRQPLRSELVPIGFNLLQTWQIACPFLPYEQTAATVGSPDERARTKEVIRDLRVPLYSPDLMFVKRCDDTLDLMDVWLEESVDSTCMELAWLRAIYRARPIILALPCTWVAPGYLKEKR